MKRILLTGVVLFLCGCAMAPEVDIPEIAHLPEGWGQFDSRRAAGSDCPYLAGVYLIVPDVFEPNGKIDAGGSDTDFAVYKLFPVHLSKQRDVLVSEDSAARGVITLHQESAALLTLERYFEAKGVLESSAFSMQEGDFSCLNGVLKFPRNDYYAMMEGQKLNFQVQVQASKSSDGSLVMVWSRGPYRSNAPEKAEFVQLFYRFASAESK